MLKRTAGAVWEGTLKDGKGTMKMRERGDIVGEERSALTPAPSPQERERAISRIRN